ncbi:2Fe-2S iron-sulfur cluster-binding protein [Zhouia sp. PK063]|uniref:2Fe-2S iron-sulfur cluster-binding protein n=1 Tax=Zhouia sp. PK063 TaxID=3373602 RepID=UPI0037A9E06F
MSQFYQLKIASIKRITPSAVTVTFEIPENLKSIFQFTPGQYITIKKTLNGKELRRSYSICSAPSENTISIGIKEIINGTFSVFANQELKENDTLEVFPPEGRFTYKIDAASTKTIGAFVAGSGITPVMSIMKTVLAEEPNNTFVLTYGNRSLAETMFNEELISLINQYPERLKVHYIFSRSEEADSLFGRIEHGTVNYVVKNKHKEVNFDSFYLCGPEHMIKTVEETLLENGYKEEQIHHELFTSAVAGNEEELEEQLEGQTTVTIMLDDEETTFVMSQKEVVLDAALNHDLDPPYSCQGGICSSCVARITKGAAKMAKNQILTDGEIADGLILTCQAHPTTATLKIDYDDV